MKGLWGKGGRCTEGVWGRKGGFWRARMGQEGIAPSVV